MTKRIKKMKDQFAITKKILNYRKTKKKQLFLQGEYKSSSPS